MEELTDEERLLVHATRQQALAMVAGAGSAAAERHLVPLLDRARRARARPCLIGEIEEILEEVRLRSRPSNVAV